MGFGESVTYEKSYRFAIRVVNLYKYLQQDCQEYILSKQLLRSGTSIGALVREANETDYWIDLLYDTNFLEKKMYKSIKNDIIELVKLLVSSAKSSKQ